jgi:hypothetical protein
MLCYSIVREDMLIDEKINKNMLISTQRDSRQKEKV